MQPLVSVIIPTYNSEKFIGKCLKSIKNQTYKDLEIIVVDNNSIDKTKEIAKSFCHFKPSLCHSRENGNPGFEINPEFRFNVKLFNRGPERSAQVNFGVTQAAGEYVYKVDSDFILDKEVVAQCVEKIKEGFDAVVVHNSPDVRISWIAKIRKFEVDMYKYDITHSSARFVKKEIYQKIDGFDEKITAGEDYDFQNKLNRRSFKTGFIDAEALHLGEPTNFWKHMKNIMTMGKIL